MAYRLKLRKSLVANVRRVLIEQCDTAIQSLSEAADAVAAIHSSRKAIKRMRALLRLVRSGLGTDRWQSENARLRDIARSLSALRDRDVARQTIAKLRSDAPPPLASALDDLATHLETRRSVEDEARRRALAEALAALTACRTDYAALALEGVPEEILRSGLEAAHRRGRKALRGLGGKPEAEALHELRKAVQVHWRQMLLISPAWPSVLEARAGEARELSMLLGDVNDHAMLEASTREGRRHGLSAAQARLIVTACRSRRSALVEEARLRAGRLFAGKPRVSAAELMEVWSNACGLARLERSQSTVEPSAA